MSQTIQCYKCGHAFDTSYQAHCKCKACRVSISVPTARQHYITTISAATAAAVASGLAPRRGNASPVPADLGPVTRDEQGQPLPKPKPEVRAPDKPRFVADDNVFIRRRMEQLAKEKAERVASAPLEGEG